MKLYPQYLFIFMSLYLMNYVKISSADSNENENDELHPLEFPKNIIVRRDPEALRGLFKTLGLNFFRADLKEIEKSALFRFWSAFINFTWYGYAINACQHQEREFELEPTEEGHLQCQKKCMDINEKYTKFLSKTLQMFTKRDKSGFIIQYQPENEIDMHKCVRHNLFRDGFSCECSNKYKIYVNQRFQDMFNDVILGKDTHPDGGVGLLYTKYNFLSKLIGFIIISQLSPKTAFYYLVWWTLYSRRVLKNN